MVLTSMLMRRQIYEKIVIIVNVTVSFSTALLLTVGYCLPATAKTISGDDAYSLPAGETLRDTDGKALSVTNPTDVTVTIDAGATVTGSDDGIHGGDATSGTMSITNNGTIESTAGGQGIDLNDFVGPNNTTTITNNAGGLIKADDADGIRPGANATVINAGTIYADSSVVDDSHDGIDFQDAPTGKVINEAGGEISGQRHGITTNGYVDVYNAAGATITGRNGSGVGSDGTGKVVNYGTIIGGYDGSATGDGDGVDIDGYATVDNYGTIKAEGAAGVDKNDGSPNVSEGLALTGGGTVINEKGALITSVQVGATLCCSTTPFLVYNYGTIHGTNVGVFASNVTFYNYGDITSDGAALSLSEADDSSKSNTLYNYGTLSSGLSGLTLGAYSTNDVYMYAGSKIVGTIENYGATTFHNDTDYTMDNTLIGKGNLTKAGTGLLDYTGDGSGYVGQTAVADGTLAVDGNLSASSVTVESGGTLEGAGSVGASSPVRGPPCRAAGTGQAR